MTNKISCQDKIVEIGEYPMSSRIEKILRPNSIALIGASRKPGSLGKMFLEAVLKMKFKGAIYPVNPKAETIDGIKTYPSLEALPEVPDLAVILLPSGLVADSMEQVGRRGIKDVIVVSAGFREVGPEGAAREEVLLEIAKKYGMNMLGPNCMGIFNTDASISFNGTFSPVLPERGHIAYVSQSGALGVAIMDLAANSDLGFSVFVSTGNKADLSDHDVLEFLYEDNNTEVITLYLESIDQPDAFRRISSKITAVKPVLAIKGGRTQSGLKAASSHTGALANPEYIMDGFLRQCGVIRKETLKELFDAARGLALQPLPRGPRTAIITNAGGPGILASDALEKAGLKLAELQDSTIKKLTKLLPEEASISNPVDMIASANHHTYHDVVDIIQRDENVDAIVLIIVKPPIDTTPARIVARLESTVHTCGKPIIAVLMAQKDETAGLEIFKRLNLPVYSYPESAVQVLGTMWNYHQIQQRFRKSEAVVAHPKLRDEKLAAGPDGNRQVSVDELFRLLKEYDIACAPFVISDNVQDIIKFQEKIDESIVLKAANEEIIHKTDAGLVALNLDNKNDIQAAAQDLLDQMKSQLPAGIRPKLLAQKQLPASVELVLGGKKDPLFGPVLMVGIGGIFVEVLKDVSFRIAPVNAFEAREMLSELRSQALLDGFRGSPAIDRDTFAYTIQQFSLLLAEHPEISEMDLNPLIWSGGDNLAMVVDVRATLE